MSTDDLRRRAAASAKGGAAPAEWGDEVRLEVGDFFEGRFRGHAEGGKSGAWLFWDAAGQLVFLWGCARLDSGFEREQPNVGDSVAVFRDENYKTRYDDEGEASGLGYGVATRPCSDPLPDADGIPF